MWGPEGIGKTVLLRRIEDDLVAGFKDRNIKGATVLRWTPATELRSRANAIDAILPGGLWNDFLTKLEEAKVLGLFGLRIQLGDPAPKTLRYALAARLDSGPLVILLDDAQEMRPAMAQELLSAAQLLRTRGAPLLLVLAGTAKLFATLNRGSTAVWKRSALLAVEPLEREHLKLALMRPLRKPIEIEQSALDKLLDDAGGQPYRLQEIGTLVVEELRVQEERGEARGITTSLAENVQRRLGHLDALRVAAAREAKESDVLKIRRHKEVAERLKVKCRGLEGKLAQVEAQAQDLSGELADATTKNAQLQVEAGRLRDERDEISKRCAKEKERVAVLESERARLEGKMTEEKDELSMLEEKQAKHVAALKSKEDRLEGKVAQQGVEIRELSGQIAELGSKNGRLQQEIEHLVDFYQRKKERRPTRWRWLFGDDRPPVAPLS